MLRIAEMVINAASREARAPMIAISSDVSVDWTLAADTSSGMVVSIVTAGGKEVPSVNIVSVIGFIGVGAVVGIIIVVVEAVVVTDAIPGVGQDTSSKFSVPEGR